MTNLITEAVDSLRSQRNSDPEIFSKVYNTLGDLLYAARIELDELRKEAPAPAFTMPTFEDHEAAFAVAARAAYLQGASMAQVSYLAKLSTEAGEMTTFSGALTATAASNLINDYLKG